MAGQCAVRLREAGEKSQGDATHREALQVGAMLGEGKRGPCGVWLGGAMLSDARGGNAWAGEAKARQGKRECVMAMLGQVRSGRASLGPVRSGEARQARRGYLCNHEKSVN